MGAKRGVVVSVDVADVDDVAVDDVVS